MLATPAVLGLSVVSADHVKPACATLTEALSLLRTRWTETEGVLNGKYSLWLGCGISRERYPNLDGLNLKLLNDLQAGIDPANSRCPYRSALVRILDLTTVTGVDTTRPPSEWQNLKDIIAQLRDKYSKALDVDLRVDGHAKDLFWDVLKLQDVYGDASKPPDAEHRFLALLVEEGVVSQLVTTNWDPLIETACEACRPGGDQRLKVVARNEEVDGSQDAGARLLKIHGCARRALQNPDAYKAFLVVTDNHIAKWTISECRKPFKELVHTILREKRALFIGLSGQDSNLLHACLEAAVGRAHFASDTARVLFAEPRMTESQRGILGAIHGDYSDHADEIDAKAALPLYAKPLLACLYVLAVESKVRALLQSVPPNFTSAHGDLVERAIERVEQSLCARYDVITDPCARWRQLADEVPPFVSRLLSMYRREQVPPTPEAYECLTSQNVSQMSVNPAFSRSNLSWLFLAVAIIVEAEARSIWTVKPGAGGGENGQLVIEMNGRSVTVFLAENPDTGMVALRRSGFIDVGYARRAVVVYPNGKQPLTQRRDSPRRSMPGRTFEEPSELWLGDVVGDAQTPDELVKEFHRGFAA